MLARCPNFFRNKAGHEQKSRKFFSQRIPQPPSRHSHSHSHRHHARPLRRRRRHLSRLAGARLVEGEDGGRVSSSPRRPTATSPPALEFSAPRPSAPPRALGALVSPPRALGASVFALALVLGHAPALSAPRSPRSPARGFRPALIALLAPSPLRPVSRSLSRLALASVPSPALALTSAPGSRSCPRPCPRPRLRTLRPTASAFSGPRVPPRALGALVLVSRSLSPSPPSSVPPSPPLSAPLRPALSHRPIGCSVAQFVAFGPICPPVERSFCRGSMLSGRPCPVLVASRPSCPPVDRTFRRRARSLGSPPPLSARSLSVRRLRAVHALSLWPHGLHVPPADWSFRRRARSLGSPPPLSVVVALGPTLSGRSCPRGLTAFMSCGLAAFCPGGLVAFSSCGLAAFLSWCPRGLLALWPRGLLAPRPGLAPLGRSVVLLGPTAVALVDPSRSCFRVSASRSCFRSRPRVSPSLGLASRPHRVSPSPTSSRSRVRLGCLALVGPLCRPALSRVALGVPALSLWLSSPRSCFGSRPRPRALAFGLGLASRPRHVSLRSPRSAAPRSGRVALGSRLASRLGRRLAFRSLPCFPVVALRFPVVACSPCFRRLLGPSPCRPPPFKLAGARFGKGGGGCHGMVRGGVRGSLRDARAVRTFMEKGRHVTRAYIWERAALGIFSFPPRGSSCILPRVSRSTSRP